MYPVKAAAVEVAAEVAVIASRARVQSAPNPMQSYNAGSNRSSASGGAGGANTGGGGGGCGTPGGSGGAGGSGILVLRYKTVHKEVFNMAHFAKLDENNVVLRVSVIDNSNILDEDGNESESVGVAYINGLRPHEAGQFTWKQTSYNNTSEEIMQVLGWYTWKVLPLWVLHQQMCLCQLVNLPHLGLGIQLRLHGIHPFQDQITHKKCQTITNVGVGMKMPIKQTILQDGCTWKKFLNHRQVQFSRF